MRVLKALGAALVLIALTVGVPALLLAWGSPLALLDVEWPTVLFRPDDGVVLLGVLSIAGWVAWLVLTAATINEVVSHTTRRRWHLHLPGVGWLQPVVGGLVALAMTPLVATHADEPPPIVATHAPLFVAADPPGEDHATVATPSLQSYVVLPGDELWGVAERQLGSGSQWRAIVGCNPGMTAETPLVPGTTLHMPAPAAGSPSSTASGTARITVRKGDTLWDLAHEHLGEAHRWPELFEANRDVIADPDEIDVGWELTVPQRPPPTTETLPEPRPTVADDVIPPPPNTTSTPGAPTSTPTAIRQTSPAGRPTAPAPGGVSTTLHSPTAQPSSTQPGAVDPQGATAPDSSLDLLGPLGGALAASLVAGVAARRRLQLLHRGIGRRITTLSPQLQRFFSALVQRSHEASDQKPDLQPTSVVVGWGENHDVLVDLEREGCTLLMGSDEDTSAMAATVLTSLLSAEWSTTVGVVAVQPDDDWAAALDDPRLAVETDLDGALVHLQRLCAQRRLQLRHSDLATVRADEDRADVWAPMVFIFCSSLQPGHLDRIQDCLSLGHVGVSVVVAIPQAPPGPRSTTMLTIESGTLARVEGTDVVFQPQLLTQPARHAVISLFTAALDEKTEPAPWWHTDESRPHPTENGLPRKAEEPTMDGAMPAWSPTPDHPTLVLLGPVDLLGARGTPPTRAVGQCMEYCAWLLLNPGTTPTVMVRELLVAEGTRRSNMSRLRSWLGNDHHGEPYLPDAYSGHIALAAPVTSDWERFQSLLAGGVNLSSTPLLKEALSLIRGRPLEGVAFQWPWVSQWLGDMLSMITDAAATLADRCLTEGDPAGALWAIDQGQLATGEDETLAVQRIRALALAGDRTEVDAAITRLTRAARAENRDLAPDSIRQIQHALHSGMTTTAAMRQHPKTAMRDSGNRPVG